MNDIRAKFEEIWPVPEGIEWLSNVGRYVQITGKWLPMGASQAYNARLDTFTRCQETMGPVLSLVDDLIKDLEWINEKNEDQYLINQIDRAKQVMEKYK